jgi:hypothetical protein
LSPFFNSVQKLINLFVRIQCDAPRKHKQSLQFSDSGSADADDSTAAADYGTVDRGK